MVTLTPAEGSSRLVLPWLLLSLCCVLLMLAKPGHEVVPFHLVYLGFALTYGFEAWPLRTTLWTLALAGTASGAVLALRVAQGVLDWPEVTEVPLMLGLAGMIVWHVRRRQVALAETVALSAAQLRAAAHRDRVRRLTSHEMRTPLTIASGYLDLAMAGDVPTGVRSDLGIVQDELGRLSRACSRMLELIVLPDSGARDVVDVDDLVDQTLERWSTVAARDWQRDGHAGVVAADLDRLRVALDTLIENAVRYTADGGCVRLLAQRGGQRVLLGVADSGPGLAEEQLRTLSTPRRAPGPLSVRNAADPESRTGLGLGIVDDVATMHGGHLVAGRSREGGALVGLVLPA